MESILDVQRALYNNSSNSSTKKRRAGPPILPHGDDPQAVLPPPPPIKKRRSRTYQMERRRMTIPPPVITTTNNNNRNYRTEDLLFPASTVPEGFPPQLAYRALAAYSLLRTLSIPLRLSPFAPTAFLRALYLPVPNRLAGQVHVAILRILLRHLKMGYHWGEQQHNNNNNNKSSSSSSSHTNISVDVVKKRKVDGLRWPLRAGDNLQILDSFTWPVFFDDYCHLSADSLYASLHDETLYIDYDTMDVSKVTVSDYQESSSSGGGSSSENNKSSPLLQEANSQPAKPPQDCIIYLEEPEKIQESDEEWVAEGVNEEDEDLEDDEFVPNGYGSRKQCRQKSETKTTGMPPQNTLHSGILSSSRVTATPASNTMSHPSQFSHFAAAGGHSIPGILPYPSSSSQLQSIPAPSFHNHRIAFSNGAPLTALSATKESRYVPTTQHPIISQNPSSLHASNSMLPHQSTVEPVSITLLDSIAYPETKAPVVRAVHTSRSPSQTPATGVASVFGTSVALKEEANDLHAPCRVAVSDPSAGCTSHTTGNASVPSMRQVLPLPESSTSSSSTSALANKPPTPQKVTTFQQKESGVLAAQVTISQQTTASVQTRPTGGSAKSSSRVIDNTRTSVSLASHVPVVVSAPGVKDSVLAERGTTAGNINSVCDFQAPLPQTNHTQEINKDFHMTSEIQNGSVSKESRSKMLAIKSPGDASKVPKADGSGNDGEKDAATILRAFIHGGQPLSHPDKAVDKVDSREEKDGALLASDDGGDDEVDLTQWPQFQAIRSMRTGIPYHHLTLEEKLDILEFLIDELLAVDEISAELTRRRSRTSYAQLPFARLPSSSDYESMENEDWCSVCRKEGELLCCDGCVASYHRKCVGLPLTGGLPEGQWYCPECTLVDPALFGPLLGGRKPCIEWASVNILDRCSRYETSNNIVGIAVEAPNLALPDKMHNCRDDSNEETATDSVPHEAEYLCVHGYVFRRNPQEQLHKPLVPLLPDNLGRNLSEIGPAISSSWPLAQIPINQSELRDILALRSSAGYRYARQEHFNPLLYENRYATAPLPSTMGRCIDTLGYESRCGSAFPHRLSNCLRADMSNDAIISKSLRSSFHLFNPYQMFSSYLLDLESKLSRASLLHESWGARKAKSQATIWRKLVTSCRSSDGIARLMVSLVDAVHVRVFDEGWFVCTRAKSTCHIEAAETVHVAGDVDLDLFRKTRLWRACPVSSLPSLLSRENSSVADWIRECRPDVAPLNRRYKRKRKMDVALEKGHETSENKKVTQSIVEEQSENQEVSSNDGEEFTQARKKLRRFRYPHSITDDAAKDAETFERTQKMKEVAEATSGPFMPEARWPIAGRKLFPPAGSLPSRVARNLGRKGGASIIPFLSYVPGFEVGQAAVCHVWRQGVITCRNFEELLVFMRILESHLDLSTIRKCTTLTQRYNAGKQRPHSQILCREIDLRNGLEYYLVQKSKHPIATWVLSTEVELGPLVARQLERYKAPCCTRTKPSYFTKTKQETQIETKRERVGYTNGMNTGSVPLSTLPGPSSTGMASIGNSCRPLAPPTYSVAPTAQQPSISLFLGNTNNAGAHFNSLLNAQVNHVGGNAVAATEYGTPNSTRTYPQPSALPASAYDSTSKTSLTMLSNQGLSAGTPVFSNARMPVDVGLSSQLTAVNPRTNTGSTYQSFSHAPAPQSFESATQSMSDRLSLFATNGSHPSSFAHGQVGSTPGHNSSTGPALSTLLSVCGSQSSLDNTHPLFQSLIERGTLGSQVYSSAEPRGYSSTESSRTAFPGYRMHGIDGQVPPLNSQNDSLEHGLTGYPPTNGSQTQFLPSLSSSELFGPLHQLNGMESAQTRSFQHGNGMSYASQQDFQFSQQGYSQSTHQPQGYYQSDQQPHRSDPYQQSQITQQMGQDPYWQFRGTGYGANSYFNYD